MAKLWAVLLAFAVIASADSDAASKAGPVSKVITLLKDMASQLEKEAEEDEDTYEGMGCWCETNDKEKTKAISDEEAAISSLGTAIEELTGKSARLNEEIATLNAEVAKNEEALNSATTVRMTQMMDFKAEEKESLGTVSSLKSAVTIMGKHQGAFLQVATDSDQIGVLSTVQHVLHQYKAVLTQMITPNQKKALESFAQQPDGFFDAEPVLAQSKQPASGEIFGILGQMKETFETNLANSQKEESENNRAFEDLKAAKTSQINAGTQTSQQKSEELADTDETNARSKEDLENTQETLEADTTFLSDVKAKCGNFAAEYAERKSTRQFEIQAVTKALEFLSSDDAHDLFSRTFSLLQVDQASKGRRHAVAKILMKAARHSHDPKLHALLAQVRLDSFGKVKESLQKNIDVLVKEKEEELQQKEACVDGFSKNSRYTEAADRTKEKLVAEIDDLKMTEDELTKSIASLKAQIAEMEKQMKYAGDDREKENRDFQLVVADSRATQKLLTAALNILKGFYAKGALVQTQAKAAASQPAGFKKYDKSKGGGVMGMIQGIIDDSTKAEKEAQYAEEDAQKAYEEFVKDTNESVTEKTKSMINKIEYRGKTEATRTEKEKQRDETLTELQQLSDELHDLHISCDYLLKNWNVRTTARDEEVEALKQAIGMFSGATFSEFLQDLGGKQ